MVHSVNEVILCELSLSVLASSVLLLLLEAPSEESSLYRHLHGGTMPRRGFRGANIGYFSNAAKDFSFFFQGIVRMFYFRCRKGALAVFAASHRERGQTNTSAPSLCVMPSAHELYR